MVCALFGLNLFRFKTTFDLTENGEYRTDIQDISKPAPNEHYRSYSETRNIGNNVRLSSVNRIDPSMVRLPASREVFNTNKMSIPNSTTEQQNSNNSSVIENHDKGRVRKLYKTSVPLASKDDGEQTDTSMTVQNKNLHAAKPNEDPSSSITEKQGRYAKGKMRRRPVPSVPVYVDADDLNDNSVSPRTSYPSYSPPPYYETMSIETKDPRSSTSSPVLSTFKAESDVSRDNQTPTLTLPSSWDLINEHRRNISKIQNSSKIGESSGSQSQELDLLSSRDSSVLRRNKHYAHSHA